MINIKVIFAWLKKNILWMLIVIGLLIWVGNLKGTLNGENKQLKTAQETTIKRLQLQNDSLIKVIKDNTLIDNKTKEIKGEKSQIPKIVSKLIKTNEQIQIYSPDANDSLLLWNISRADNIISRAER